MDRRSNQKAISGIIPPLVTPLTKDANLDVKALGRLIEHALSGGVHGIFLLGSTGEGPSLTNDLRKRVMKAGVRAVDGRVPVFINITSASYLEALCLAKMAQEAGADYLVLAPPYYFKMNQLELKRYFERVAERVKLPLLLYNAPKYTKTAIAPASTRQLANHENIIGLKDSTDKLESIQQQLSARKGKDFPILVGSELLLGESLLLGCDGGINGGANLYPGLYVNLYQAAIHDDKDNLEKYHAFVMMIHKRVFGATDSPMRIVIALKHMLSLKGICEDHMAMPVYRDLTVEQAANMQDLFNEFEGYGY